MVIVDDANSIVAFVGGIDLAVGRYDTGDHTFEPRYEFLQDW
jgi:hypothetical protein